jgi:hypothetical protein
MFNLKAVISLLLLCCCIESWGSLTSHHRKECVTTKECYNNFFLPRMTTMTVNQTDGQHKYLTECRYLCNTSKVACDKAINKGKSCKRADEKCKTTWCVWPITHEHGVI